MDFNDKTFLMYVTVPTSDKAKKKPKMNAMFRSDEITLCQMFIQPEAAYTSVSELGETGAVQFRDVSYVIFKATYMIKIYIFSSHAS